MQSNNILHVKHNTVFAVSSDDITELNDNEIFVFGSNEAGIHGSGAAKLAYTKFGAEFTNGIGRTGQCYGIPTKGLNTEYRRLYTLPINSIRIYVNEFIEYATQQPELNFLVTKIGCGLAGLDEAIIAPLFKECLFIKNIFLPHSFVINIVDSNSELI